jgi:RecB family exonuclease
MTTPGVLPQTLALRPLKQISPSKFLSLTECSLREIWSASRQQPSLPNSPAARLGSVIHQLLEISGKGLIKTIDEAEVRNVWDGLIRKTEQEMGQSWLERVLVPLNQTVPQYEVRRIRACMRSKEILSARASAAPAQSGRRLSSFETWIETSDGLVGGAIDEIQETEAGAVLRDYKSGYIAKAAQENAAAEIDTKYTVQLKLYAALFASKYQRWPARIEIVPLQGAEQVIDFNPSECKALLHEAVVTLNELNREINRHLSSVDEQRNESAFANPSPENCRFCLFRPNCTGYRASRDLREDSDWPLDVWGTVSEFRLLGNGRLTIAITRPNKKTVRVRGLTGTSERHPAVTIIREGQEVAIFNLRGNKSRGDFSESQSTVMYLDSLSSRLSGT